MEKLINKFFKNTKLLSVTEYAADEQYHRKERSLNKQAILKQIWEKQEKLKIPENEIVPLSDTVFAKMVGKQYVIIVVN